MSQGIDLVILRVMRERQTFEKMYRALPISAFDEKTTIILKDFEAYFKTFETHDELKPDEFASFFFAFQHPTMDGEVKGYFKKLLPKIYEPVDDDTRSGLVERILDLEFATTVGNIVQSYDAGNDIDVARAIEEATETLRMQKERRVSIPWVQDDIHDLLAMDEDKSGLTWRLRCLNGSMRPLRAGDFGIIAARPDAGKTSFLTSELTFMSKQLPPDRPIIWFNNEGVGQRIVTRQYQSGLNCSIKELIALKNAGTIESMYTEATGGRDMIRILDIHDCWNYEIADILDELTPGLIVFDMIDNIKFGGQAAGSRTDQVLEGMYQWARVKGVKMNCPILATSQISAEGDGLQYPTLPMLKDSKTGKQGAADFIITIGRSNDPILEGSRFMGLTKNKLTIEDGPKDPREEVLFDYVRGRFNDVNL